MTTQDELSYYRYEAKKFEALYNMAKDNRIVESINADYSQKLYKKVGKKYVQVNDPYAYSGLREGWWLVGVKAGSTSIRQAVYPAKSDLQAAAQEKEEKLIEIIRDATEARPSKTPLSKEEKKDWDAFMKKHGESFNSMYYPSFADNARKIVEEILKK